jgi:hypothetical protein
VKKILGFTLLELMVIAALFIIIVSVTLPLVSRAISNKDIENGSKSTPNVIEKHIDQKPPDIVIVHKHKFEYYYNSDDKHVEYILLYRSEDMRRTKSINVTEKTWNHYREGDLYDGDRERRRGNR